MYRVAMQGKHGLIITHLCLEKNKLDLGSPMPWLFRGIWEGSIYYGELVVKENGVHLLWSDGSLMKTDIEDALLRVGAIISIEDTDGTVYRYSICNMQKL